MKQMMWLAVLLILVCAAVTSASAQPMVGQSNLSLSAAYDSLDIEGVDIDIYALLANYGQFTSEQLEVGGTLGYVKLDAGGSDMSGWLILGNAKYYMQNDPESTTVPYVGLQGGWINTDLGGTTDSSFAWGGMAGAKMYTSPDHFWFVELNYLTFDIQDVDVKNTMVAVGQGFVL